jgi:hypothetical protein
MAKALHLVKDDALGLALATIQRQLAAGDSVTVVALHGARVPAVPAGAALRRLPEDLGYEQLLEAMFEADQVIAW